MRMTKMLAPTTREVPAEAEIISHQLLIRSGFIRRLSPGVYNHLPLMWRTIRKVENIVREEMDKSGALELHMPVLQPAELWEESGRLANYGKELMRIKDRHDRLNVLGPTHEEIITTIAKNEVRSYRQLPINLYQIQVKFRDEIRPRFGLMRGREFPMKDAYSFHSSVESLEETYQVMCDTYTRIFKRCGLETYMVESDVGAIGGSSAHEFMVIVQTSAGENDVLFCNKCNYAANSERAESIAPLISSKDEEPLQRQKVETPAIKTIEDLCKFLNVKADKILKSLLYKADDKYVMVVLPGDAVLNEIKLKNHINACELRMALPEEIKELTGADAGFVGAFDLQGKIPIIGDLTIKDMKNFVLGLNEIDFHYINANWEKDYELPPLTDLRTSQPGETCIKCNEGVLKLSKGIEVGNTFKLGTKYSKAMNANYTDVDGKDKPFIMGCYGIGITRIAQAAVEKCHDADGIIWPAPIAPYLVTVFPANMSDPKQSEVAENIYKELLDSGIEVMFDDREERAGVKFKDADLIGFPLRITAGKALAQGLVEIKERATGTKTEVKIEEVKEWVLQFLKKNIIL